MTAIQEDLKALRHWVQKLWGDKPIPKEVQPDIDRLLTPMYIERPVTQKIFDWLDELRLFHQSGRLIAPAGTGKSATCEYYLLENKPKRRPGRRDIIPVLLIESPEDCSPGEFFALILETLRLPVEGQVPTLRRRTIKALKEHKVEMVIVDEANFLTLKTLAAVCHLYNQVRISFILTGTETLNTLITRSGYDYVHDRFIQSYQFSTMANEEMTQMVETYEEEVVKLPLPSNLTQHLELLQRKTGGKIRHLDSIIRKATLLSLKKELKRIEPAILTEVLERYD